MSWKPNIGIRCKDTLIYGSLQKVSTLVFIELFSKNAFCYFLFCFLIYKPHGSMSLFSIVACALAIR